MVDAFPPVGLVELWCDLDAGRLGELALARVVANELRARARGVKVVLRSPRGGGESLALDGGHRPLPIGDDADSAAILVIGDVVGGDRRLLNALERTRAAAAWLGPAPEADAAGIEAWAGAIRSASVRGASVRERLAAAAPSLSALPDGDEPILLAGTLVSPDAARRRVETLRMLGNMPEGEPIAVVLAGADVDIAAIRSALAGSRRPGVLVPIESGARGAAAEAAAVLHCSHLPATTGVDDAVAVLLACSGALVATGAGASLARAAGLDPVPMTADAAVALGDPQPPDRAMLGETLLSRLAPSARRPPSASLELSAELDRVGAWAAAVETNAIGSVAASPPPAPAASDADDLLRALDALRERMVAERTVLQAEVSAARAQLEHLERSWPHRALAPARRVYRRWHRSRL